MLLGIPPTIPAPSRTNDEVGRKFLLWKAQQWMKLVEEKERLFRAPAPSVAQGR